MPDDSRKIETPTADIDRWLQRVERAETNRKAVASIIDECYEFGLPLRARSYSSNASDRRTERLFDSTAIEQLQSFASRQFNDIWPPDAKPFEMRTGRELRSKLKPEEIEQVDRSLAEVTEDVTDVINNSDFRSAASEAFLDYGIATGVLLIEQGNVYDPLRCTHIPLPDALLDRGPMGTVDALFVPREVEARDIPARFPGAVLNEKLQRLVTAGSRDKIKIVEGYERDWSGRGDEVWVYRCVAKDEKHELLSHTGKGIGSKPFIDFTFMRAAGEIYARGPMQMALPDVKSLNVLKELILENADLAVTGLWQGADDGIMNPDTVRLIAGTVVPVADVTNGGIRPIERAGDFNVGDFAVDFLTTQIKRLFGGDDLGPPTGTPMSATEVAERTRDRASRLAGPYGRLISEFLFPVVRRVIWLRRQAGAIKVPAVDGRQIVIQPIVPVTRAQDQDDVLRHIRYVETLNGLFGPQVTQVFINQEVYLTRMAQKMGVDPNTLRTSVERQQLAAAIAQAAQMAQQAGVEMPAAA